MVRMLLIGYRYGLCSEWWLSQEVELNLAYRWFCRLGLEDAVPGIIAIKQITPGRITI